MILESAEEAITICINEGINVPELKTDDEKIAWYEKQMDFDREEIAEPF